MHLTENFIGVFCGNIITIVYGYCQPLPAANTTALSSTVRK